VVVSPAPTVAEHEVREDVDRFGAILAAICDRDEAQQLVLSGLGPLYDDVPEVPASQGGRPQGVNEFVLELMSRSGGICRHKITVWIFIHRVQVAVSSVGCGWTGIFVEVYLFAVLAVVPFRPGQSKKALLEDRVSAIP